VLRLIAVRERDVREVDVERPSRLDHLVHGLERGRERLDVGEGAVARRVHVCEVEDGPDPAGTSRDLDHVLEAADLAHPAHHLDAEGNRAVLALQPLTQLAELLADRVDRLLARPFEQETRMAEHELRAGRLGDPCRVVEHPGRHVQLLAALRVAHEARDRRVHRQDDLRLARELAELRGPVVVHPELALEVDLAGVEAELL